MKNLVRIFPLVLIPGLLIQTGCSNSDENNLGIFENHGDVGSPDLEGSVEYDPEQDTYQISGSGANMWFDSDAFHFLWRKDSGDLSIAADIDWQGEGVNPHRKAGVMIRQSLAHDAPYVDAVVHGDGLTSIQYREEAGGMTREIQSNVNAPDRIKLEKEGEYVYMSLAKGEDGLQPAGGSFRISFKEPFYVGLAVCAHDSTVVETATFSNVAIVRDNLGSGTEEVLESTLETINIASRDRRVVYVTQGHIEAPNWMPDGERLVFNSNGLLYKIPLSGGDPEQINTGFAIACNNDHGISPDGTQLVISDQSEENTSIIYTLPIEGGTPQRITPDGPSYWHGWSPDGKMLAYCAERNGEYDIYVIPADGSGEEIQLTTAEGLDDGPDYSPDGEYIYFNSVRTGTMQIWRMKADGSEEEQITTDEYNDWFAHPSPDGKWIVFVSYESDVEGHPANKDVMLRLMDLESGEITVLAKLFGGQGTINVPSWSPDSENVAFVSYRLSNH